MEGESISRHRCFFTTVVWGNRHVKYFLDFNIPTMLAPGNLPAFAAAIDTTYIIYTTERDRSIIENSSAFQKLRELIRIEFSTISAKDIGVPVETHYRIWQREIDQATRSHSFVFLMPPDVVWSDGSFGHMAKLIVAGKEAIFLLSHLRAVTETFLSTFEATYPKDANAIISVDSRDLVELALEHAHPMIGPYMRNSLFFPHHSELIVWPVAKEGLLVHILALVPSMFRPDRYKLTNKGLLAEVADPERLHCVTDSDNLYMVSLTELGKDTDWYRRNVSLSATRVGQWWLQYSSPSNDIIVREPFRVHFTECTKPAWRRAELIARTTIHRLLAVRDGFRVVNAARELKCHYAADLLVLIIHAGLVHRIVNSTGPFIFLIPTDAALDALWKNRNQLLTRENISSLLDLLRSHCISVAHVPEMLSGKVVTAEESGGRNTIALRVIPALIAEKEEAFAAPSGEFRRIGPHYAIAVPALQKTSHLAPAELEVAKPLPYNTAMQILDPKLRRPCVIYHWYDRYYAVPASLGLIRPIELTMEGLDRRGFFNLRTGLIAGFMFFPTCYLFFRPLLCRLPYLAGVCRQFERSRTRSGASLSELTDDHTEPTSASVIVGFIDADGYEYRIYRDQNLYFAVPVFIDDFSWRYTDLKTKSSVTARATIALARRFSILLKIAHYLFPKRSRRLVQYVLQERVISAPSLHDLDLQFHLRKANLP